MELGEFIKNSPVDKGNGRGSGEGYGDGCGIGSGSDSVYCHGTIIVGVYGSGSVWGDSDGSGDGCGWGDSDGSGNGR